MSKIKLLLAIIFNLLFLFQSVTHAHKNVVKIQSHADSSSSTAEDCVACNISVSTLFNSHDDATFLGKLISQLDSLAQLSEIFVEKLFIAYPLVRGPPSTKS